MFLLSDFQDKLRDAVSARPAAATAYRAGDPLLLAQMDAMAHMMAMVSQQIDVAEAEPFLKARDGTVLADAALKGVLPLAKPAKMTLTVTNTGPGPITLATGRSVLDGKGRRWLVEGAATIAGSTTGTVSVVQKSVRTITHTVANATPFYAVLVPPSPDGLHFAGVEVADPVGDLAYAVEFCNVLPSQRVFMVETDEFRRLWVRFGANEDQLAVHGHQVKTGDVLTIRVTECEGAISLAAGAPFALEYVGSAAEALLSMAMSTVNTTGAEPPTIEVLRMLARYPAMHDANAVFLADFDFLLRRHLAGIEFLSVWNEQIEEAARGPSVNSINKLFVSFSIPDRLAVDAQAQIKAIIARADNTYAVTFVTRNEIAVPLVIKASVATVHDTGDVSAQIRAVVIAEFGKGSIAASQGLQKTFRLQRLQAELKAQVPALQDQISDFAVVVGTTPTPKPEDFRYVSVGSLDVQVTRLESSTGLWSA